MPYSLDLTDSNVVERPSRVGEAALRLIIAILLSIFFFVVYGFCNQHTATRSDVGTFYFEFERYIPLIPWMVVPYMSIDLFFFVAPFLCDRRQLLTHGARVLAAISIAAVFFLAFPLRFGFERPEVHGIFAPWFGLLWSMDQPYNMAPSLHLALRTILWPVFVRRITAWGRTAVKAWFILIGVSTLFTYQHHLIDVISGQFLGIACLYFIPDSDRAPAERQRNVRIAARYAMGVVSCIAIIALAWPWGALAIWPAVALAIVMAGYLGLGGAIFRKSHGRLPNHVRWMLGPYLGGALLVHRVLRRRCNAPQEIQPGVWLGRRMTHTESARFLQMHSISAVLDLTAEFSDPQCFRENPQINYLNIPMLDLAEPTPAQLDAAREFIEINADHGVFVHCALGHYRAGRVAALLQREPIAAAV